MANTSGRKFWIILTLTAIPATDFVGANWFYTKHTLVGLMKIALCLIIIALVYVANVLNHFGAAFGAMGVIVLGVIWWIVDIFLVVLRKRL
jgi:hypothetical protein